MSDLRVRLSTGVVFAAVLLSSTFVHPLTLLVFYGITNALALAEFQLITSRMSNNRPNRFGFERFFNVVIGSAIYLVIALSGLCYIEAFWVALVVPLLFIFFIKALFTAPPNQLGRIATNSMGIIWVSIPLGLAAYIANIDCQFEPMRFIMIILFTWAQDSFAYLVGSRIGRTKLFPSISPKKTWEGLAGGLIACVIWAVIVSFFYPIYSTGIWIAIGLITAVFGIFGDLIESLLKRNLKIKDTGTFLPGHGGILDRFDALIFAIPFVALFLFLLKRL